MGRKTFIPNEKKKRSGRPIKPETGRFLSKCRALKKAGDSFLLPPDVTQEEDTRKYRMLLNYWFPEGDYGIYQSPRYSDRYTITLVS